VAVEPVKGGPVAPVAPVAPAAFCPEYAFSAFGVTEARKGVFHFSFDVLKDDAGKYLKRYQIQVLRNRSEFALLEVQVDTLGGPHNRRAIHEWNFPGTDPGTIDARMRVHYPNECHDDGGGQPRLNGPWSGFERSQN